MPDHISVWEYRSLFRTVKDYFEGINFIGETLLWHWWLFYQYCFNLQFSKKNILEIIGKQISALLESEVLKFKLSRYLRKNEKQSEEFSREKYLSEKETYALQYLTGYIFCELYEKFKVEENKND